MACSIGIYGILNTTSGKLYIGQSSNLYRRWAQHKSALKHNKHGNRHLQSSYNKHGLKSFTFFLLTECSIKELTEKEQSLFRSLLPEFNIRDPEKSFKRGVERAMGELEKRQRSLHQKKINPNEYDNIRKLCLVGFKQYELAKLYRVDASNISRIVNRKNRCTKDCSIGVPNDIGAPKLLTEKDFKDIRHLYKIKEFNQYQLRDIYNVTQSHISRIINQKHRKREL